MAQGTEIRKRKNDAIDSVLVAELLRYGDFVETSLSDEETMSLRNLSRFRGYLVSSIGDLKRKVICVLDLTSPEYQSVFSNIFGQTSKELLLNFSSPSDYENISANQLEDILKQITLKKFATNKINNLTELAKKSFGIKFVLIAFLCS